MIHINKKALEIIKADAIASYPDECCGFMFGSDRNEIRYVTDANAVVNVKEGDRRRRFLISPKDYMDAERYADANGVSLLGIYHSHPEHPAVPSEHDRIAAQPYFSYVILSIVKNGYAGIRSWRLNDESQFEEELFTKHEHNTKK
jgi:proteasome lid subunit RPN8/RPN11